MLTMMFAVGDTMEAPQSAYCNCAACGACLSNLSGSPRYCFASLAMTTGRRFCFVLGRPLLRLPAAADLLGFALVLDLRDRAQHLEAELAVGLAVDLHGALVLDHVAGVRIDRDPAARSVGAPALQGRDHLLAVVELAVELLDGVEDRMHRIPCGGRHEVRIAVRPIGVVPCLDELLVGRIV